MGQMGEKIISNNKHNKLADLQTTDILEGAGFLTGAVLAETFTAACLGVTVEVEAVEPEAEVAVETEGFPAVDVVTTGAEFTNTGSVEGIGLPNLVWSFTTFPRTEDDTTI